jgi:hypothetical protein
MSKLPVPSQELGHSSHSSVMIAKRSLSLSKTYVVIAIVLSVIGIVLSNIGHALLGLNPSQIPQTQVVNPSDLQVISALPLISVPLMVFSTLTFATPVMLLYVYDKNNGVLEYFLSLGMNQTDIYKGYLKAALLLASIMFSYEILASIGIGLAAGSNMTTLAETSILTPTIGYPAVSFVTIAMMAFSSLQKQRVGSNQPLGMGFGVMLVLPTYLIPLVAPAFAIVGDLIVAAIIITLSLILFILASRLIRREKLLP